MKLFFRKCRDAATIPRRATPYSAGLDLSACLDMPVTISPGGRALIPTGLCAAPDDNTTVLMLYARSGLAVKNGITMVNGVGVVDADYRGEICIPLINLGNEAFTVTHGMRIAQLVVSHIVLPDCETVDILPDTQRGTGGFGSTGI